MAENEGQTPDVFKQTVKIGDREQTYEADTLEGLVEKVANAYQEMGRSFKDRERENYQLRQQVQSLEQKTSQQNTQHAQPASSNGGFSRDEYWKKAAQDPHEATDYLMKHKYDMTMEEMVSAVRSVKSLQDNIAATAAAQQFLPTHPDFPATAEASQAVNERVQDLMNRGFPMAAETLDLAYRQLVDEGRITPVKQDEPAKSSEPSRGSAALPGSDDGRPTGRDIPDLDWDSMSTEEMEKKLVELHMK